MNTFFYKILPELPPPPARFIEAINLDPNVFPTTSPFHEVRVRFVNREGKRFLASPSVRARLPDNFQTEFEQWVKENIIDEFLHVGVNYRHFNSDTGGMHSDTSRDFSLTWNITTGGPNAGITWWQEQGQPLIRELGTQLLDFDIAEPVAQLRGHCNGWFLQEARILHSTEGLESPRVQFQVSLNADQIPAEWLRLQT